MAKSVSVKVKEAGTVKESETVAGTVTESGKVALDILAGLKSVLILLFPSPCLKLINE